MKEKRVLITGGAGFIGTALADKLRSMDIYVEIVDLRNKITKYHDDNFKCWPVDVRNIGNFEVINGRSYDMIYHLAAQTSGAVSQENPELDIDTNVKGTLNVCIFARKNRVPKIVFSSSMAVYGSSEHALKETDILKPLSIYGVSKVSAETFIKSFSQYGIKYTIVRLFNVYGPGQDMRNMKQGMASIYMAQAVIGKRIDVTGSLDRFRDFVYIDDAVNALLLAGNDMDDETVNVGTGRKVRVCELIDSILAIQDRLRNEYIIENIGSHDGDQHGTFADNSKIKSFGWEPTVTLDSGLREMYNYATRVLK